MITDPNMITDSNMISESGDVMWNWDLDPDSQLEDLPDWIPDSGELFPLNWEPSFQPWTELTHVDPDGIVPSDLNGANGLTTIQMEALEVGRVLSQIVPHPLPQTESRSTNVLQGLDHGALAGDKMSFEPRINVPTFWQEPLSLTRRLNDDSSLPFDKNLTPEIPGSFAYAVLDLEGWPPVLKLQQDVDAIGDSVLAEQRQENLVSEAAREPPGLDTLVSMTQAPLPGEIRPQTGTRPQTETKSTASRCAPCRFAGVPKVHTLFAANPDQQLTLIFLQSKCDGSVGSVCTRCQHLKSKVAEETRRRVRKWLDGTDDASRDLPQFLIEPSESLSLPKILFFELSMIPPLLSSANHPYIANMAVTSRSTITSRRSA